MILINSSPKDALKVFQPFLPIFVPVGIGCLLAITEKEGIKAKFIDEQIEDDVVGKVVEYVKDLSPPYIFGFSVLTAALNQALIVSKQLKTLFPNCIICFGGIHPTAVPEEILSFSHVDLVVRGEGEEALIELYKCLKEGRDYTHIGNLSYRIKGQIFHNKSLPPINDLSALPPFPYHLFTSERYDLGFVVSSRGCPYNCIFCSNRVTTGKKYRIRSTEAILDELVLLRDKYNRSSVLFLDDNLLVNKKRIYQLIEGIKHLGLHNTMIFNFQARGDNVTPELLKDLYDAGFRSVFFGLETSSERIMKIIQKGETVAQCLEAVKISKKIGFHVSATFIYALPTETHNDRIACAKLARTLDLNMVRFNNATPYPGTELYYIVPVPERRFFRRAAPRAVRRAGFFQGGCVSERGELPREARSSVFAHSSSFDGDSEHLGERW